MAVRNIWRISQSKLLVSYYAALLETILRYILLATQGNISQSEYESPYMTYKFRMWLNHINCNKSLKLKFPERQNWPRLNNMSTLPSRSWSAPSNELIKINVFRYSSPFHNQRFPVLEQTLSIIKTQFIVRKYSIVIFFAKGFMKKNLFLRLSIF